MNCVAASFRNEARSSPASAAISPRMAERVSSMALPSWPVTGLGSRPVLWVKLKVRSHPLAEEHRMMAFEHPLAGAVADGP